MLDSSLVTGSEVSIGGTGTGTGNSTIAVGVCTLCSSVFAFFPECSPPAYGSVVGFLLTHDTNIHGNCCFGPRVLIWCNLLLWGKKHVKFRDNGVNTIMKIMQRFR